MMHRLVETTAELLSSARLHKKKSQPYMARCLGRSLSTVQNWENGTSVPKLTDIFDWFSVLGINPLRACLECIHPCTYKGISPEDDIRKIDTALLHYLSHVAPEHERRELAFCIFGPTGSSWSAQLDELTARNHLPISYRINISQTTVTDFILARSSGTLRAKECIMPDIENVSRAIDLCLASVLDGKDEYQNT